MLSSIYPFDRIVFGCFSLALSLGCIAQPQNNWWYFHNVALDFNSGTPVLHTSSAMSPVEGSASIANAQGDLQFYTDGVTVFNRANVPMPNGDGLLGDNSSSQSALIVPRPSTCGQYYVFTVPSESEEIPFSYSLVDMELDGGQGDVTIKNVSLHTGVTERLTATIHANEVDYWVAVQRCSDNAVLSFHITADGIDPTPVISAPPPPINDHCYIGYLKFAPNGTKLCASYLYGEHAILMDYNNATGIASDPILLFPFVGSGGYGVEFSSSSEVLYIQSANAPRVLVQYDLQAGDPTALAASRYVVDSVGLEGTDYLFGGALQMAPNGIIYVNRLNKSYLGIVRYSDALGSACGYMDNAVDLSPLACQDGLPNLLSAYPSCTAGVGIYETPRIPLSLGPNPASSFVQLTGLENDIVIVTDMSGREIDRISLRGGTTSFSVAHLMNGCYLVRSSDLTLRLVIQH